ncbi:hypothetical protein [Natrinema soli]|uniref:Uncharacterized protein n=1 Tax=Natrinema soli TaxID=1930624 RepID=A0ABD5SNR3_9EURY|nr:hypothetical protein [Natrinema soli]
MRTPQEDFLAVEALVEYHPGRKRRSNPNGRLERRCWPARSPRVTGRGSGMRFRSGIAVKSELPR